MPTRDSTDLTEFAPAEDPTQVAFRESPLFAEVGALGERSYTATSPEGHVTVTVNGLQRLTSVTVNTADLPPGLLGQAATAAADEALNRCRQETLTLLRTSSSVPESLRSMLGAES